MIENNKIIDNKFYQCCIIGAGPAGLAAALELTKYGVNDIIIIDKNKNVGGLSRTEILDDIRFDIGPHRFFTKNKEINKIWHQTLKKDFRTVKRLTYIFYKNKLFRYPIEPFDVLSKLNSLEMVKAGASFIYSFFYQNKIESFEDYIIKKFGKKLYEIFFKDYTEKIWEIPCSKISAEWAMQRIKGLDFFEVVKNAFLVTKKNKIKTLIEEFNYPIFGSGQMYERIAEDLIKKRVKIVLSSRVIKIYHKDNRITSIDICNSKGDITNIKAEYFFSSIPLFNFFKMLEPTDSEIIEVVKQLKYRDHITVNLIVDKDNLFPAQWIYISSSDIQMARVTNYNNFSKAMVGKNKKTALSVEYFTNQNQSLWNTPDKEIIDLAINELKIMSFLKEAYIENAFVVKETEAYPVYYLGFLEYYNLIKSKVNQFINLYSIGRAGLHKYNNMDHSMISGILAARNYLKLEGAPYILWNINIDTEYLESEKNICDKVRL